MSGNVDLLPPSDVERFDMIKDPRRVLWFLRPITWLLSFPSFWIHRAKIEYINMEGLKKPYLLLCNHNAFLDFKIATVATFPHQAYYVVAIDGFIGREWLMRNVGCIGKRKFTSDLSLIKNLQEVIDRGKIAAIYPEARYSLCGTNSVLPKSLGKLAKMLQVPVVTLISNGHHVNAPFWNTRNRGVCTRAKMTQIISKDEIAKLQWNQIYDIINKAFYYDDFKWQFDNKIAVKYKNRAKGLHKVLYQCPACNTEYSMNSDRDEIWCEHCGKRWKMSIYGDLSATSGETYFSHIPNWYEWEREQVRKEVEDGTYSIECKAIARSLPNSKGFVNIGDANFVHNSNGFTVCGEHNGKSYTLNLSTRSIYSCHIEYNYGRYKRDAVELNTLNDSVWLFPLGDKFSVTKISLATEELYRKAIGEK